MIFKIECASETDWNKIPDLIKQFDLDTADLKQEQFVVCKSGDVLCGFGRIRNFDGFDLFSSLCVLPEYRNHQAASLIINELLLRAKQDVYFVTAVPAFFRKKGFEEIQHVPAPLKAIAEKCALSCACTPSVMRYQKAAMQRG